ncbi:MAG: hypothetical protein WC494_01820 [Candidatus Pacearchaeota archaeon]
MVSNEELIEHIKYCTPWKFDNPSELNLFLNSLLNPNGELPVVVGRKTMVGREYSVERIGAFDNNEERTLEKYLHVLRTLPNKSLKDFTAEITAFSLEELSYRESGCPLYITNHLERAVRITGDFTFVTDGDERGYELNFYRDVPETEKAFRNEGLI